MTSHMIETNDADRIGTQPTASAAARSPAGPRLAARRVHRVVAAVGPDHPAGEDGRPRAPAGSVGRPGRHQPLGRGRRSGRCRRRAARPGPGRASARARRRRRNRRHPRCCGSGARRSRSACSRVSSSSVPSVDALSTTTIAAGAVGLRPQRGEGLLEELPAVPRHDDGDDPGTHRAHPTDRLTVPMTGRTGARRTPQQALDRSVAALAAYPSCRLPIDPPTVDCCPRV